MGAIVDFGVLNLLAHVFDVPVTIAGVISFSLAVTSNFIWNRYWTYPESRAFPPMPQYLQFFIINATALLIRVPILALVPGPVIGLLRIARRARPARPRCWATTSRWRWPWALPCSGISSSIASSRTGTSR